MTCEIRVCRVADILHQDNTHLMDGYNRESSIDGMPTATAHHPSYLQLERAGALHCFGAYIGESMVGFATVIISVLPHYSARAAVMESIFVDPQNRKIGAGIKLFRAVQRYATDNGACGLLISAPVDGHFARMLNHPRSGFKHTNQIFFKRLT